MQRTLLNTLFSILVLAAFSQEAPSTPKDTRPIKERIWFGGGVGLNFGTVTSIQLDPMVGYKIDQKNRFSTGVGLTYWHFRDNRSIPAYEANGYGYRLFTRYRPIPQFYAHAEFLHVNAETLRPLDFTLQRIWIPHVLIGGGYVQSLGGRSSIFVQVLFDVLQDPNSLYAAQPLFSGGVGIGF